MPQRPIILATAQAQFAKSASKTVMVVAAWRRADSTLDRPAPNGTDGWTQVRKLATYTVVANLRDQGFSDVNLEAGHRRLDVRIDVLL